MTSEVTERSEAFLQYRIPDTYRTYRLLMVGHRERSEFLGQGI